MHTAIELLIVAACFLAVFWGGIKAFELAGKVTRLDERVMDLEDRVKDLENGVTKAGSSHQRAPGETVFPS